MVGMTPLEDQKKKEHEKEACQFMHIYGTRIKKKKGERKECIFA
jgi:hypothetical protein